MIKLNVAERCHKCPYFEPIAHGYNRNLWVRCKYEKHCNYVETVVKKQMETKTDEDKEEHNGI